MSIHIYEHMNPDWLIRAVVMPTKHVSNQQQPSHWVSSLLMSFRRSVGVLIADWLLGVDDVMMMLGCDWAIDVDSMRKVRAYKMMRMAT